MKPFIFKRRLKNANGRNWPGIVVINPDAPYPAAVLAQEWWEAMHKLNPLNLLRVLLSSSARRKMEIMGHETEVQAAAELYGLDALDYRRKEARAMKSGYDGLFGAIPVDEIEQGMRDRSGEALAWVTKRLKVLK